MLLSFHGACREVTGSNILLETDKAKILLDCGFFQGYKFAEERNYSPFAYIPSTIDAVVLCHAHLDHVGRLPKLVRDGFSGKIYSTAPTKELTYLVCEDNEKLMREESQRDNHAPLYTKKEIEEVMNLFTTISYNEKLEIVQGVSLTFENAGHILGSAVCIIEAENKKLVYTSDLGNTPSQLLDPPENITFADYVICESTYGGQIHEDATQRFKKLATILNSTIKNKGVLMIPTFAIERTQELLHDIDHFCTVENCEKPQFYLDSPLAEKVTRVFEKYPEYLNNVVRREHKDSDFFGKYLVKMTTTVDQSKSIREHSNPKVVIAGSGMMNGGRILFHLIDYIGDQKNTLLVIGYQAFGTLGRKLLDGEHKIRVLGRNLSVGAKIEAIGSYSAHADSIQIINWLNNISGLKKIFLVHGESDQQLALAKKIKMELGIFSEIPQMGESYVI